MKMSVWKKWQRFLATRRPPKALVLALHIWLAAPQVCRLLFSEHYGLSGKAMLKPSIDKTFHTLTDIVRHVIYCAILMRPIFRIPRQSNVSVPNRMNDAGSALQRASGGADVLLQMCLMFTGRAGESRHLLLGSEAMNSVCGMLLNLFSRWSTAALLQKDSCGLRTMKWNVKQACRYKHRVSAFDSLYLSHISITRPQECCVW